MNVRENNNIEDKKVSDKKERYKIHLWFNRDLQKPLRRLARVKGLTMITLLSKIIFEYLMKESKDPEEVIAQLEESKELYKIDPSKLTKEQYDKVLRRIHETFIILKKHNSYELVNFEKHLDRYIDAYKRQYRLDEYRDFNDLYK